MANIAQMVNVLQAVILTNEEQMVLTPTYYVFKMYQVHQGANMIPVNLKSENYEFNGQSVPAISSSASVKEGIVNITLTNSNPNKAVKIECEITGYDFSVADGQIISAKNFNDFNNFGEPEKVTLSDFKVDKPRNGKLKIEIPAHSVVLVQLK